MKHNPTHGARSRRPLLGSVVAALLLTAAGPAAAAARDAETYIWNAELVALDEAAGKVTVRTRVVSDEGVGDLAKLEPGTEVVVFWSGFTDRANGVRRVYAAADHTTTDTRFHLPTRFVEADPERRYLTIEVTVPGTELSRLVSLEPGEWVTLTSSHAARAAAEAVVAARPYVQPAQDSTS